MGIDSRFLLIGIAVLLLAVIILLVVLLARSRKRSGKNRPAGITMKVVVVSGRCKDNGRQITLRDQLIIGSAPSCGIVFQEDSVAPQNTRVFLGDGGVFIEDLNPQSNTAIGGMKIYSPNRLRSGDEITMGGACLRLLF